MDEKLIRKRIREFTWYTPIDFGNGMITAGNFKVTTELESIHFGLGKWRYIIERNLPDLQGKRVMDLGCNNGIFCIEMARMGATDVIGVDSEKTWPNWRKQAEFVKEALEWRCRTTYPISFFDSDMDQISSLNLGHLDVVIALCSIYYLEEDRMFSLLKYLRETTDLVLIQCNTRKEDQTPEVHRKATPQFIGHLLKKVGFPYISFDKPFLYERPIIVGSNYPVNEKKTISKVDRLRFWIRRKI